jgi:hypothetical protein
MWFESLWLQLICVTAVHRTISLLKMYLYARGPVYLRKINLAFHPSVVNKLRTVEGLTVCHHSWLPPIVLEAPHPSHTCGLWPN